MDLYWIFTTLMLNLMLCYIGWHAKVMCKNSRTNTKQLAEIIEFLKQSKE